MESSDQSASIVSLRAVYDRIRPLAEAGESPDAIENALLAADIPYHLVDCSRPLVIAVYDAFTLGRASYRQWRGRLQEDMASRTGGCVLALIIAVPGLWLVYHFGTLFAPLPHLLGVLLAVLLFPAVWLLGWPVFWLSRWRARRRLAWLDSADLDALDFGNWPREPFFDPPPIPIEFRD